MGGSRISILYLHFDIAREPTLHLLQQHGLKIPIHFFFFAIEMMCGPVSTIDVAWKVGSAILTSYRQWLVVNIDVQLGAGQVRKIKIKCWGFEI